VEAYRAAFAAILPSNVELAVADRLRAVGELSEEERRFVTDAVESRRREFAIGRACARRALAALGYPPVSLPVGSHRQPLWPADVVGSITHSGRLCAASVARRAELAGLGIDAEQVDAVTPELISLIESNDSIVRALTARNLPLSLLFSGKEAAFKAWFPRAGFYLDFRDVELVVTGDESFSVRSARADLSFIRGRYAICDDLVLTSAIALS
jgi:4'-phosphopantetheinyl transferase EntD